MHRNIMPDCPNPLHQQHIPLPARGPGTLAVLTNMDQAALTTRAPDLVFQHANGFNAATYRDLLAPLARDFAILAIDLRGHGATTLATPQADHRWSIYADDLAALISLWPSPPAVLAGHSMGGTTALLAAHHLPHPAPRLVLFDPVLMPEPLYRDATRDDDQPLAQGARRRTRRFASAEDALAQYRGRGAFRSWPDATLRAYLDGGLRADPEGGLSLACDPDWEAANFACALLSDPYPALRNTALSLRILKAQTGSTCHAPDFAHIHQQMIEGSSHFLPMERPDLFESALRAALAP